MVQDRYGNVNNGHSNGIAMPGKTKNGVSKTSTRTFDSVRSNSSMLFSANSSGGEETGKYRIFIIILYYKTHVLKFGKLYTSLSRYKDCSFLFSVSLDHSRSIREKI